MNVDQAIKINAIITGATGMVGEGVLLTCLQNPQVESVLVLNRKPCGIVHPKLKEVIHQDFYNLSTIEDQLKGYNACFFCLGVSSVGMKEDEYYKLTYILTMRVAETLSKLNTDMTFCYVSGGGTDSTEKGSSGWARVKGKTENDLMKLPFKQVFAFRPGFIKAVKGQKYVHKYYRYIGWLYPIGRALYSNGFCTMEEIGLAMIHTLSLGNERRVVTGKELIELSKSNVHG